jgi:hypothetical protein
VAQPRAKLVVVNGMNHVFKLVENDRAKQIASYGDSTLPIAPNLKTEVIEFVRSVQRQ